MRPQFLSAFGVTINNNFGGHSRIFWLDGILSHNFRCGPWINVAVPILALVLDSIDFCRSDPAGSGCGSYLKEYTLFVSQCAPAQVDFSTTAAQKPKLLLHPAASHPFFPPVLSFQVFLQPFNYTMSLCLVIGFFFLCLSHLIQRFYIFLTTIAVPADF